MTYALARAALLTALSGTSGIIRGYADPPDQAPQDRPCVVLFGSQGRAAHPLGGQVMPDETHTEKVRVYVKEAKVEEASATVRTLRTALLTTLSNSRTALGGYGSISEVSWGYPSEYTVGGIALVGFDMDVAFVVKAPR